MQAIRPYFVGGNWKSNGTLTSITDLVKNVLNQTNINFQNIQVAVAPIALHIPYVKDLLKPEIQISAQNCSLTASGAYTGQIAAQHLLDFGINWTILGHSERRNIYKQTDQTVSQKVKIALQTGLSVIACIGQNLQQRQAGVTLDVVTNQLNALKPSIADWSKVVIAYEPVWAIGTGRNATPQQAQEVHASIRHWLASNINEETSTSTRVIYGGSVTDQNCGDLISQPDVDGFLVGGASLKPAFKVILETCNSQYGNQFILND